MMSLHTETKLIDCFSDSKTHVTHLDIVYKVSLKSIVHAD
jgi:hypothetical protein